MREVQAQRLWRVVVDAICQSYGQRGIISFKTNERVQSGVPDVIGMCVGTGQFYCTEVKVRRLSENPRNNTRLWEPESATELQRRFIDKYYVLGALAHYTVYVEFAPRDLRNCFLFVPVSMWDDLPLTVRDLPINVDPIATPRMYPGEEIWTYDNVRHGNESVRPKQARVHVLGCKQRPNNVWAILTGVSSNES